MPTALKDALKKWEETFNVQLADAVEVNLCFQYPPINKMDNTLAALVNVTFLSLSSNQIDKIAGIGSLKNLKVLCLSRNQIKSLSGLEALGDTLEQLWISYNMLNSVKGIQAMKVLRVFYIAYNSIKDWSEVNRLAECPKLSELLFFGNPLVEHMEEAAGRLEVVKRLPNLTKLDGDPVISV